MKALLVLAALATATNASPIFDDISVTRNDELDCAKVGEESTVTTSVTSTSAGGSVDGVTFYDVDLVYDWGETPPYVVRVITNSTAGTGPAETNKTSVVAQWEIGDDFARLTAVETYAYTNEGIYDTHFGSSGPKAVNDTGFMLPFGGSTTLRKISVTNNNCVVHYKSTQAPTVSPTVAPSSALKVGKGRSFNLALSLSMGTLLAALL